jgi:dsDNA-specific endonuclease/ATPase MutS2
MKVLRFLRINWVIIRNSNFAARRRTLHEKIIKAAQREIWRDLESLELFLQADKEDKQKRMKQYRSALFQNKRVMMDRTKDVSAAM